MLTVDNDALIRRGRIDYVFVADNNIAKLREVSVGAKGNKRCEILEGLEENDIVIVSPPDEMEDGDKISY